MVYSTVLTLLHFVTLPIYFLAGTSDYVDKKKNEPLTQKSNIKISLKSIIHVCKNLFNRNLHPQLCAGIASKLTKESDNIFPVTTHFAFYNLFYSLGRGLYQIMV